MDIDWKWITFQGKQDTNRRVRERETPVHLLSSGSDGALKLKTAEKTMIVTKKVEGEVDYNDGQFAEGKTIGIEGIEKDLWLGTFQIHRENTEDTPDEFRQRFTVGTRLNIVTVTEFTTDSEADDLHVDERHYKPDQLQ